MTSPYVGDSIAAVRMRVFDNLSPEDREALRQRMDRQQIRIQREDRDDYIASMSRRRKR